MKEHHLFFSSYLKDINLSNEKNRQRFRLEWRKDFSEHNNRLFRAQKTFHVRMGKNGPEQRLKQCM